MGKEDFSHELGGHCANQANRLLKAAFAKITFKIWPHHKHNLPRDPS